MTWLIALGVFLLLWMPAAVTLLRAVLSHRVGRHG